MDHAHVLAQVLQAGVVGVQAQHRVGAVEQQAQPHGAVVQHLRAQNLLRAQAQGARDQWHQRGAGGAALERGRGKRQGVAAQGNAHQAQRTFLDHHAVLLRAVARLQPGVAGAQRGVARKRQLAIGAEDAQAVVGPGRAPGVGGRHQKGGFRQVGPGRKAAHVAVAQAVGIQHHGHGVAVAGAVAEHVDLLEGALVHGEAHARG